MFWQRFLVFLVGIGFLAVSGCLTDFSSAVPNNRNGKWDNPNGVSLKVNDEPCTDHGECQSGYCGEVEVVLDDQIDSGLSPETPQDSGTTPEPTPDSGPDESVSCDLGVDETLAQKVDGGVDIEEEDPKEEAGNPEEEPEVITKKCMPDPNAPQIAKGIIMESPKKKSGGQPTVVYFTHMKHTTDYAGGCDQCHPPLVTQIDSPLNTMKAIHDTCRTCHPKYKPAKTFKCDSCHMTRNLGMDAAFAN